MYLSAYLFINLFTQLYILIYLSTFHKPSIFYHLYIYTVYQSIFNLPIKHSFLSINQTFSTPFSTTTYQSTFHLPNIFFNPSIYRTTISSLHVFQPEPYTTTYLPCTHQIFSIIYAFSYQSIFNLPIIFFYLSSKHSLLHLLPSTNLAPIYQTFFF